MAPRRHPPFRMPLSPGAVVRLSAVLAVVVLADACGDGDGPTDPPPDPPRPAAVTVSPATTELAALGATAQLSAAVRDQNGNVMTGAAVSWSSSDASVATVGGSGLVTAAGNGTATITAIAGSVSGSAAVTVAQRVAEVAVSPSADTLVEADTLRFSGEAADANGHAVAGAAIAWASSDTLVASVDETGLVTGVAAGEVEISATSSGVTGVAALTVTAPVPTFVEMTPDTVALTALGQTAQLAAEVRDQAGRVMKGQAVAWASADTLVATVDSAGLVTAAGQGGTRVVARAGRASGEAVVTVMQAVGSVVVSPPADTVALGDTLRLAAEAFDANANAVAGAAFSWSSSDPSVAAVDGSGLVTGVAEGAAAITAMTGDARGVSEIVVASPDRAALVALYNVADGPNWVNTDNWLTDAPLREWYGVGVHGVTGRVIRLHLQGNYLTGAIPAQIGKLSELADLDLGSNDLGGVIPREIGQLANLSRLSLQHNRLEGAIPQELGNLVRLRTLSLYNNALSGPVPAELGELSNLRDLYLGVNALEGALPAAFQELTLASFFFARNAGLCAPGTATFAEWLDGIQRQDYGPFCNESDVAALESLYETAGGTGWTNSAGWRTSGILAEWYGIRTDSLGRVTALDLSRNGVAGHLPSGLGQLDRITELRIGGNPGLSGRIPFSLVRIPLETFHYGDTDLCAPSEQAFRAWLDGIQSHDGTDVQCTPLTDRDILVALFNATGGTNWTHTEGWLTHADLREWHGVQTDRSDRVTALDLSESNLSGTIPPELGSLTNLTRLYLGANELSGTIPAELGNLTHLTSLHLGGNGLSGTIPPELGSLTHLTSLYLGGNGLSGTIPAELGSLTNLTSLYLGWNGLSGTIPPELGSLTNLTSVHLGWNGLSGLVPPRLGNLVGLTRLNLSNNQLSGSIPREIADLANLASLSLDDNVLSGSIPPGLGDLANLTWLDLGVNKLSGPIPPELGNLGNLTNLSLGVNELSGRIPPELGNLGDLVSLRLDRNELTGSLPSEFSDLGMLRELSLAGNADLAGPLPIGLTFLGRLAVLRAGGTGLCAPSDPVFREWLRSVSEQRVATCDAGTAYLTQAVQSREFPVPLVADEDAMLRVFVTAADSGAAVVPPVRARFYLAGEEAHVAETAAGSCSIPTEVDEGNLCASANVQVPAEIVQPGLETVIEIDPGGTLHAGLGLARRIPESGRMPVDVRAMPDFELTLVPFLWSGGPDSTILAITAAMAARPGEHENLWHTRTILPVGKRPEVRTHPPVLTASNSAWELIGETGAVRALESGSGYWMGTMSGELSSRVALAAPGGWTTFVPMREGTSSSGTIAHELGHNMSLAHAPCGGPQGVDPFYPHRDGRIGSWGYDPRDGGRLVSPDHPDLMSYCRLSRWIGDYSFTKALLYRLAQERPSVTAAPTRSIMLWGGVDPEGNPYLEPAFVVDAPPALPTSVGPYSVTGRTTDGIELFSLSFRPLESADGDGASSFVFILPADPGWVGALASITLATPSGEAVLDADTDRPMTILRNPNTRQVRGFLRGPPSASAALAAADTDVSSAQALDVLFSRGIPGVVEWRR